MNREKGEREENRMSAGIACCAAVFWWEVIFRAFGIWVYVLIQPNFELLLSRAVKFACWLGLTCGLACWLRCAYRCWLSTIDCDGAVGRVAGCLIISPVISHVCICVCVCAGVMQWSYPHLLTSPHLTSMGGGREGRGE